MGDYDRGTVIDVLRGTTTIRVAASGFPNKPLLADEPEHRHRYLANGRFRLLGPIGKGASAEEIQLAYDSLGRKFVCMKYVVLDGSQDKQLKSEMLLEEARVLQGCLHENIVKAYELGYDEERKAVYLAMQDLPRGSLRNLVLQRVKKGEGVRGPFYTSEAVNVGRRMARGIKYLHEEADVVHGDVTPGNVLLGYTNKELRICDLGLTRNRQFLELIRANKGICGTPQFMAPELIDDDMQATESSDLYGLGATLYFCTTGKLPFPGASSIEIIHNVATRRPLPPRQRGARVSEGIEAIIMDLMEKDPSQRPGSAQEVLDRLHTFEEKPVLDAGTRRLRRRPPSAPVSILRSGQLRMGMEYLISFTHESNRGTRLRYLNAADREYAELAGARLSRERRIRIHYEKALMYFLAGEEAAPDKKRSYFNAAEREVKLAFGIPDKGRTTKRQRPSRTTRRKEAPRPTTRRPRRTTQPRPMTTGRGLDRFDQERRRRRGPRSDKGPRGEARRQRRSRSDRPQALERRRTFEEGMTPAPPRG